MPIRCTATAYHKFVLNHFVVFKFEKCYVMTFGATIFWYFFPARHIVDRSIIFVLNRIMFQVESKCKYQKVVKCAHISFLLSSKFSFFFFSFCLNGVLKIWQMSHHLVDSRKKKITNCLLYRNALQNTFKQQKTRLLNEC